MATTGYKFPWEWLNKYREERIRKNSVVEKRRKKIPESSCAISTVLTF